MLMSFYNWFKILQFFILFDSLIYPSTGNHGIGDGGMCCKSESEINEVDESRASKCCGYMERKGSEVDG